MKRAKCETLADVLAIVAEDYGTDALLDGGRLAALMSDYLPRGKAERNFIRNMFAAGLPARMADALGESPAEQRIRLARFAQTMTDEYYVSREIAEGHLWAFAEALGWAARPAAPPVTPVTPITSVTPVTPPVHTQHVTPITPPIHTQPVTPTTRPAPAPFPVSVSFPVPPLAPQPAPKPVPKPAPAAAGGVEFGGYDWRVLAARGNKALLLCEYVLEKRAYHGGHDATWAESDMRAYLNGAFLGGFGARDAARVVETRVMTGGNPQFGTPGGLTVNDRVFLLSLGELVVYLGGGGGLSGWDSDRVGDRHNAERAAYDTRGAAAWWWLRSPGSNGVSAAFVYGDGSVGPWGEYVGSLGGVRPALWVAL
jgi:hypothetical protein